MDKRYQVFVSSTYTDLREAREEVLRALLELDCIPAGMELFPASDEEKLALIKRVIDDCDYYIVIIGGRYGSLNEQGIGYTEAEYRYAEEKQKPILAFVHAEPDKIEVGKSERSKEGIEKHNAFLEKESKRMCRTWRTPEELGGAVSRSLVQLTKRQPGEGWVRARHAAKSEEVGSLRAQIEELKGQLESARVSAPPESTRFAQGQDVFSIRYRITRSGPFAHRCELSWDDIFRTISPHMLDASSESKLKQLLEVRVIREVAFRGMRVDFDILDDDFQTIKIQLKALGLIARRPSELGFADSAGSWSLTPFGEHYATRLLAIVRDTVARCPS